MPGISNVQINIFQVVGASATDADGLLLQGPGQIGALGVNHCGRGVFGSSLNGHVHFHVCVVDGVFEEVAGETDAQSSPPSIVFHPVNGIDETAVGQVQTDLRRRILRAFMGRGRLESVDSTEMLTYQHCGFSVDAGVLIEADDRAALWDGVW